MKKLAFYSISMVLIFSAWVCAQEIPIQAGEYYRGTIVRGDPNVYTFSANVGEFVIVLMAEVGQTNFYPQLELYDPNWNRTVQCGEYSVTIRKEISQCGKYWIIPGDCGGSGTGEYGLTMIKIPGTNVNERQDGPVPTLPGEYKSGYIAEGDLDVYTFYADAGDSVTVLMGEVVANSPLWPQVELYEPNWSPTVESGESSATIRKEITESGICTIIARDRYGHLTGKYDLSLQRLKVAGTPEDDFLLSDKPDPIIQQDTVTLSASEIIDSVGWIVQVDFYRDLNHNSYLDLDGGDQLYGSDYDGRDGWSWSGSIGCLLPVGENTYFARAKDNDGLWSDPVSTTGRVLPLYEVDFSDFGILGTYWFHGACGAPNWCDGADNDKSGSVDFADLAELANSWLREQTQYEQSSKTL